ncbi:hypothetical protein [Kitasatospora purpeofusca]|uniref:hypothetical protein n=1 Tax=Kitasatospora purpeofusca TaxID=67352 RepID=UPI0036D36FDE
MSRRPGGRIAAAALASALVLGGACWGAAPAAAAPLPIDQCTTTSGVVLAVDFGTWGGPLLRSCGTTPTTGYALLNQGGWKTTGTGHDGPAFICRIGYSGFQGGRQYPTPDQEKCVLTPPASAYWSYWHADPGQNDWSYSQLGAMSYQPKPGSVDLWIFGGTNIEGSEGRPSFSPDTVRAHNTAPGGGTAVTPDPPQPPAGGGAAAGGSGNGGSGNGGSSGSGGASGGASGTGSSGGGTGGGSGGTSGGSSGTGSPGGGTGSPGGGSGGGTGGAAGGTERRPSPVGKGGTTKPASPSAGAPAPVTPEPEAPATPTAPAETPSAQPTDTPPDTPSDLPSATDTAGATAGPTSDASPSLPVNAGGPVVMDAAPAADAPHDAGSMVPVIVGAVLVTALGAGTAVAARRRRREAE